MNKRVIPKSIIFAVYGTLRKNSGNHHYLNHPTVKYLGTTKTKPEFTMQSMGGFPGVFLTGSTPITIELYETSDPHVIENVYILEGYTGVRDDKMNWYDTISLDTEYGEATMFVFKNKIPEEKYIIKSGDWRKG